MITSAVIFGLLILLRIGCEIRNSQIEERNAVFTQAGATVSSVPEVEDPCAATNEARTKGNVLLKRYEKEPSISLARDFRENLERSLIYAKRCVQLNVCSEAEQKYEFALERLRKGSDGLTDAKFVELVTNARKSADIESWKCERSWAEAQGCSNLAGAIKQIEQGIRQSTYVAGSATNKKLYEAYENAIDECWPLVFTEPSRVAVPPVSDPCDAADKYLDEYESLYDDWNVHNEDSGREVRAALEHYLSYGEDCATSLSCLPAARHYGKALASLRAGDPDAAFDSENEVAAAIEDCWPKS